MSWELRTEPHGGEKESIFLSLLLPEIFCKWLAKVRALLLSYLKNCLQDQVRPKNKTREMRMSTKLYKMRGAPNSNKSKANVHFHRKIKGQKGRNCATYKFKSFTFCSIFLSSRRCELNVTCVARTLDLECTGL